MKKIILISLFTLVTAYAQQLPQYTQYMLNPYLINPAVGGTTDHFDIKAGYRNQWMGFNSRPKEISGIEDYKVAPITMYLTAHGHIGKDHQRLRGRHKNQNSWHHGVGLQVINDRAGPTSHLTIQGSYSYDMSIRKNLRLSFGAFMGINQWSVAGDRIKLNDGSQIPGFSRILPSMSFGMWLYHKYWFAGLSVLNLVPFGAGATAYPVEVSNSSVSNRLAQHYFFTGGAIFHPSKDLAIIPSLLLRPNFVGKTLASIDINTKIRYRNMVWGGLSLRNSDAFAVLAGVLIDKKIEIGISYDYTINSSLRPVSGGTLEFMLGYRIDPRAHVMSPSDFW